MKYLSVLGRMDILKLKIPDNPPKLEKLGMSLYEIISYGAGSCVIMP
jgi:hypothetical protein